MTRSQLGECGNGQVGVFSSISPFGQFRVTVKGQTLWRDDTDMGMPDPNTLKGVTYYLICIDERILANHNAASRIHLCKFKHQSIGMWAHFSRAEQKYIRKQ